MNGEIAKDVTAHQPISPMAQEVLLATQVSRQDLDTAIGKQQDAIRDDIARVGVLLAMSRPQAMNTDPYVRETVSSVPPALSGFARYYGELRHNSVLKQDFDSQVVQVLLRRLGPSNHLRRQDGFDAAFELGRAARLLENDFQTLPRTEQRPERRYGEALLAEELALLWAPTIPQKAQNLPEAHQRLLFNAEDPNVFNDQEIATIPEKDRWKLIGAQSSAEAADLFGAIAESGTASPELRLEASSRATDMGVRRLNILAGATHDKAEKQELRRRAVELCVKDLDLVSEAWRDPRTQAGVSRGKLYEFLALAKKRYEVIVTDPTHTVRLALPREDATKTKPLRSIRNELVNLSVDMVEEDANGNFVRAFQVKSMTEDAYRDYIARFRIAEGKLPMVYPERRADMIFLDSSEELPVLV